MTREQAAASIAIGVQLAADATDEASIRKAFEEAGTVDDVLSATSSGVGAPMPPDAAIQLVGLRTAQRMYGRLWAAYDPVHLAAGHGSP